MCTYSLAVYTLTLVWAIIVVATFIVKTIEFGASSAVLHFTNWNFLAAGIFYLLVLPFVRSYEPNRCLSVRTAGCVVAWIFFPLYLNTWFVFAVVTMLLAKDPEFITDLFEVMDPGVVMLGDAYFHFVPLLAIIIFVGFFHNLIFYGVNRQCRCCSNECGGVGTVLYTTYLLIAGSLLFIATYRLVLAALGTSPNEVYGTDVHPGAGFLLLLVLSLVFNGSYLFVLDRCHRVRQESRRPRYDEARAMLKTDDELFGSSLERHDRLLDKQLDTAATSAMMNIAAGGGGGGTSPQPLLARDLDIVERRLRDEVHRRPPEHIDAHRLQLEFD